MKKEAMETKKADLHKSRANIDKTTTTTTTTTTTITTTTTRV